jgi:hypothetical protein
VRDEERRTACGQNSTASPAAEQLRASSLPGELSINQYSLE